MQIRPESAVFKTVSAQEIVYVEDVPYKEHWFTTAERPITDTEQVFDLEGVWKSVIVLPEVDAHIEFDKPIDDRTPYIPGGATFNAIMEVKEIHYKNRIPGTTGNLYVWVFR